MSDALVLQIGRTALTMALLLSGPMLAASLVVGIVVSVLQALTQVNDATVSFVPKILVVFLALALAGPWLLSTLVTFTISLFRTLPEMVR